MAEFMKKTAAAATLAAVCCAMLYRCTGAGLALTLAVTAGTIAYHFGVRLLIGALFDVRMRNRADYTKKWYQVSGLENRLYQKIAIKRWKGKMPTYDPAAFDMTRHSWDEIVQAMCQSELVHETNIVFSFLPVLASAWFGAFWVFLATSFFAAAFDSIFVMIQRYNRLRILNMMERR